MSESPICPSCGTALASGLDGGMCPACLLKMAMGRQPVRPPVDDSIPTTGEIQALFADLEIIGLIARGGMGVVYQVRQPTLDRFAALKILPRDLAAQPGFPQRFHREARTMAALNHPNIVTIHESGERGGLYFLLMEYVDGGDLGRAIRQGAIKPREALSMIQQICDALQYAHDAGFVHRDIKPGNILLDSRGRVKVADFGISRIMSDVHDSPISQEYLLGTPEYMAPEQREGSGEVDHRADIYSLGAVFYELLTGKPPLGENHEAPSKCAEVDSRIDGVVGRAMEKDPQLRYQHASELHQAVERISRPGSYLAWSVAAALIVGAAIIAGAILSRGRKVATVDPYPPVWENSLGMRFRPVPGTDIKMSIWETRIRDWRTFEKAKGESIETKHEDAAPNDPIVVKNEDLALEFCTWLTRGERKAGRISGDQVYRLPSDSEWSLAAGLKEAIDGSPEDLHLKNRLQYPWGTLSPVPPAAGNYPDSSLSERIPNVVVVPHFYDGHAFATQVGSFPPNAAGFHDLGGNLWELVTAGSGQGQRRIYRGGSWFSGAKNGDWTCLLSSFRAKPADVSNLEAGFRIVLASGDAQAKPGLLAAARDGDMSVLIDLITAGVDLDQRDSMERTALYLAARGGHVDEVSALIRAGADVHAVNQAGDTALHAAAAAGCLPAAEALVKAGAKVNCRTRLAGIEPIHYAALKNHPEMLAWLADQGADIQASDHSDSAPIHHAACNGADAAIEWLAKRSVPIDVPAKGPGGVHTTPLGFAIIGGNEETCSLLLRLGASANPASEDTSSPLSLAAMTANLEIVRMLLRHGADPKAEGIGRATSLDLASLQVGKFTDDIPGLTAIPLQRLPAKPGQRSEVIRLLVKSGMPIEQRFPKGFTPLLNAAYRGNIEAVRTFLELGADPDAMDDEGFNALHSAAEQGFVKVVELLAAGGAKIDVPNGLGRTALDCATNLDHDEVILRLLDAGANPDGLPSAVSSPLNNVAQLGHPATLSLLLERGANPNLAAKSDGTTPLISAAAGARHVKSMIYPPGNKAPPTGSENDYADCVRMLLAHGADPRARMTNGNTALHTAADQNQTEIVNILLDSGLPPDILDHNAFSPLHRAAQRDSAEAAAILLDRGASIAHPLNPSAPLHVAAATNSLKVAALLLERGANPNLRDGKSATPLHWAVSLAHPAMVTLLAKHKADLAARDFCYNTPLHCAVASGKPEIVRTLLDAGADPTLRNIEGATPMDFATTKHLDQMILILSKAKNP